MTKLAEVEELVRKLSPEDRLRLLETTWASLDELVQEGPMPEWHKAELDAGLAEYRANPGLGLPMAEAMAYMRGQLNK
jgi:putative addiction module component (TIGR02574 family)